MDLILWRHAEAQDELDRGLTPKGERQAQRMADWVNRHLPASARVLVSPARCAVQTAERLDRKLRQSADAGPESNVQRLLDAVRWPDGPGSALVVAHQPLLGQTVAWLLARQAEPWPIRKGGLWWLRLRVRGGLPQVMVHAALAPDMV